MFLLNRCYKFWQFWDLLGLRDIISFRRCYKYMIQLRRFWDCCKYEWGNFESLVNVSQINSQTPQYVIKKFSNVSQSHQKMYSRLTKKISEIPLPRSIVKNLKGVSVSQVSENVLLTKKYQKNSSLEFQKSLGVNV